MPGALEDAIEEMTTDSELTPALQWLGCLRGIGNLTGLALAVKIGDWTAGGEQAQATGDIPSRYQLVEVSPATAGEGQYKKTPPGASMFPGSPDKD